jgi:poly(A) polymerase
MSHPPADPGGLEARLRADPLFNLVREALIPSPACFYAAGACLPETLTCREPGGLLLLCATDPAAAAETIARGARLAPVPSGRREETVIHLTRHGERSVTLVPLAPGDMAQALARSSFTVLGMAVDLARPGDLIDPLGGLEHLERGILVAASPLEDDPERLLLAARLCSQYQLVPDEETRLALRRCSPRAEDIEPRRAWAGLSRVFDAGGFSGSASFLKETGVLERMFPALGDIYDVPQNYYHHLGVWDHTLATLDNLEEMLRNPREQFKAYGDRLAAWLTRRIEGGVRRRSLLILAALVHDAGKSASMSVEPSGRIRFQGHGREGARLACEIAERLGLGRRAKGGLVAIVRDHMRLGFLLQDGETTASRLTAAVELGPHCPEVVLLSLADRMATRGQATTDEALERFRRVAARLLADWFWLRDCPPLIGGQDIIVHGGVEQGPEVGRALMKARVAQRECTISSRSQALEFLAPDFKGKMNMRGNGGEAR